MRKEKVLELKEGSDFATGLWRFALRPRERLKASEWIARHFRHGAGNTTFDFELFPWLGEPADSITDYRIEESLLICPPQVGKSLLAEACICFFVVEDPADISAYTHTEPLRDTWSEQRVIPSLKKCLPAARLLPGDAKLIRKAEVLFPHMVLDVLPANLTHTQSRSRRIVICDERWLWEAGRYDNAKRRTSSPSFAGRRKVLSFSNSGVYEADVEAQWRDSDQRVLAAACPECAQVLPFKWSEKKCRRVPKQVRGFTIDWDENEVTRPQGVWNIDEVVKTVRLVCPACKGRFEDTPKIRATLRRSMRYLVMNPNASIKTRAWSVSGVAVYPWADLVKQFLRAMAALDLGDEADMKEFILKGINEPWSEDVIFDSTTNSTGDYSIGQEFKDGVVAAMTVDYQELAPFFWYVIRDWAEVGPSRLRRCGYAYTWENLREIQAEEKVPDRHVLCDVSYDPTTVLEKCAGYDWIALRGRDEDNFIHTKNLKTPVRMYFSEPRYADPSVGTDRQGNPWRKRAIEILWANSPVKDILARLYGGKGAYFGVPRDVPQFYLNHMAAERKQVVETRGTREIRRWVKIGKRPNHLWDCEAMQIVFALMRGPLRRATAPPVNPQGDTY